MTNPTDRPLPELRTLHGRSTRAWADPELSEIGTTYWLARSGAAHADYNLALCHDPDTAATDIAHCVEVLTRARRPAVLGLAGGARAHDQQLRDLGWVPVGDAPFMARSTAGTTPDPNARPLEPAELPLARALVGRVFGLTDDIAEVALTTDPDAVPGRTVWGIWDDGVLASCLLAVRENDALVCWSLATDPARRRRGLGGRLMDTVYAAAAADGVPWALHHASAAGESLYFRYGFAELERWTFWSRSRWVLAST